MQTIEKGSFVGETIDVDGKEFRHCTFERCVLRFHGRETFATIECRFIDGCTLALADHAGVVVEQLRAFLGHGGGFADAARHFLFGPDAGPSARLH
jgi:hypothetical protein